MDQKTPANENVAKIAKEIKGIRFAIGQQAVGHMTPALWTANDTRLVNGTTRRTLDGMFVLCSHTLAGNVRYAIARMYAQERK